MIEGIEMVPVFFSRGTSPRSPASCLATAAIRSRASIAVARRMRRESQKVTASASASVVIQTYKESIGQHSGQHIVIDWRLSFEIQVKIEQLSIVHVVVLITCQ